MRELLHSVALRAARYLEDIQDRRVGPSDAAVRDLARFHEPMPEMPSVPEDVIAMLDEVGSPATMGISGRRFFGCVIGVPCPPRWAPTGWPLHGIRTPGSLAPRRSPPPSKKFP